MLSFLWSAISFMTVQERKAEVLASFTAQPLVTHTRSADDDCLRQRCANCDRGQAARNIPVSERKAEAQADIRRSTECHNLPNKHGAI